MSFKEIISFEIACERQGIDPTIVPDVSAWPEDCRKHAIADYKLCIIAKAVNPEGWVADYKKADQKKYWPWHYYKTRVAGSGFACYVYLCDYSVTSVGARHTFADSERAIHVGETFLDIYEDFKN